MCGILSDLFGAKEAFAWARAMDARINTFHSSARFKLHMNNLKNSPRLVVIVFGSYWAGPVKMGDIIIRNMADRFTDVEYIRIEAGELYDVAEEFQVRGCPTFVLLKKGKEIDRVVGAKEDLLQKKIQNHRALQP